MWFVLSLLLLLLIITCVLQYVGWYEDDGVGGIEASLDNTLKADPDFG